MVNDGLRTNIASATSLVIISYFAQPFRRINPERNLCLYLDNTERRLLSSFTLITFPYLIKLISLLIVVLGILTILVYHSTAMTFRY